MMIPKVQKVIPNEDFTLTVYFTNGQVKKFNAKPYLKKGIFLRLADWTSFSQVYVALGTVVWPGELDIAPETLYLEGV
jgi:hypothetical protein